MHQVPEEAAPQQSAANDETMMPVHEHDEKVKEAEDASNKMREALRQTREDLKECRRQMRNCKVAERRLIAEQRSVCLWVYLSVYLSLGLSVYIYLWVCGSACDSTHCCCQSDTEDANKKLTGVKEEKDRIEREMKLMEGKLAQALQQKREAYTKSRKVDQERERHQREMDAMVQETETTRREMEQKLKMTAEEQIEYQAVTGELRSKLEKELRQLQKDHAQAEEDNAALMEDRVNLIAQLTETKIQSQENLQKIVGEKDELLEKLEQELGGACADAQAQLASALEDLSQNGNAAGRVATLEMQLTEATQVHVCCVGDA